MLDQRGHVARILATIEQARSGVPGAAIPGGPRADLWRPFVESWRRCFENHRLDPGIESEVLVLTSHELRTEKEQLEEKLRIAAEELDRLFEVARLAGYSTSFASNTGIVICERSDYDPSLYPIADRPGAVWSEAIAGTNGVGTSLIEARAVSVYLNDHFYPGFTQYSCAAVPVYGASPHPVGAFNVSICNPDLSEDTHRVVHGLTAQAAERLDLRLFQTHYRRQHVIRLGSRGEAAALLAVDRDGRIVGANHVADRVLRVPSGEGDLWTLFEHEPRLMQAAGAPVRALRDRHNGKLVQVAAIEPLAGAWRTVVPAAPARPVPDPEERPMDLCAGRDPAMAANVRLLRRVSHSGLPILLLGETGAGKDTLARAIHAEGERSRRPFVGFNCASVPESLIDSELFGYGAGAFTGARRDGSPGRLVEADGGVLFLDEIGDMPLSLQTRLLRVLESGEVMPLGGGKVRRVDVQVIAATHRNLERQVADGAFREDLFYRLAGVVIEIPALRQRADLDLLVERLVGQTPRGHGMALTEEAWAALRRHPWPGNVRELRHVLQRAVQIAQDGVIDADALMLRPAMTREPAPAREPAAAPAMALGRSSAARDTLARTERDLIAEALARHAGNAEASARSLGISRATFYRKMRQHKLAGK